MTIAVLSLAERVSRRDVIDKNLKKINKLRYTLDSALIKILNYSLQSVT